MGKGDKKTAKGKRVMGSYGNVRKRKESSSITSAKVAIIESSEAPKKEPQATKKVASEKGNKKTTKAPKTEA